MEMGQHGERRSGMLGGRRAARDLVRDVWAGPAVDLVRRMQDDVERLVDSVRAGARTDPTVWSPSVDVIEREGAWVVEAELPGVGAEDVDVECTDETLTVRAATRHEDELPEGGYLRAERRRGVFQRVLALPPDVDLDRVDAELADGVLRITLPKLDETPRRSRRVEVRGRTRREPTRVGTADGGVVTGEAG